MPADEWDSKFERTLARHFSRASGDSACPDAGILAAYFERSLSAEEMTKWQEHIGACARCQEALSLVEQSENVLATEQQDQREPERVAQLAAIAAMSPRAAGTAQASARLATPAKGARAAPVWKLRPRAAWAWIVPLGAVAASVIVWVGVYEIRNQRVKQMQVALERLPAPLPAAPQANVKEEQEKEQAPAETTKTVPRAQKPLASAPSAPGGQSHSPGSKVLTGSRRYESSPAGVAGSAALELPPSASSNAESAGALLTAPKPEAQAAAPSVSAQQSEEHKKAQSSNARIARQLQAPAAAPAMRSAEVVARPNDYLAQTAIINQRYVVAPGEKHAWRLDDGGRIEVSTDHGKTWKPQSSGVSADLTAGSATSDEVCWVVGKSGALLLTVDGGKHWNQIASPITSDLGGVHATDASHASIWDVSNRTSFETNDGGVTWQRSANE